MSRFLVLFLVIFGPLVSPASAQTAYLQLIEDVPLPQSYRETPEAVVFEGADGRIVQTNAVGRGGPGPARRFYLDTLPALGWSSVPDAGGDLAFNRGRERLSIMFSNAHAAAADVNQLQFRLVTRTASQTPD